jgi:hypothetical protein
MLEMCRALGFSIAPSADNVEQRSVRIDLGAQAPAASA